MEMAGNPMRAGMIFSERLSAGRRERRAEDRGQNAVPKQKE